MVIHTGNSHTLAHRCNKIISQIKSTNHITKRSFMTNIILLYLLRHKIGQFYILV